jgi:hypothetical protein
LKLKSEADIEQLGMIALGFREGAFMMRRMILVATMACLGLGCESPKKPPEVSGGSPRMTRTEPSDFPPPPRTRLLTRVSAKGDQIYTVKAGANGSKPEWSAATPDAKLFDNKGQEIGRHGKGPHWTMADGGTVVGQLPPARKAVMDPSAVPWLQIDAKPGSAAGSLKDVTVIQRINTTGGLPPAADLTDANIGKDFRVPYTAEYLFYAPAK